MFINGAKQNEMYLSGRFDPHEEKGFSTYTKGNSFGMEAKIESIRLAREHENEWTFLWNCLHTIKMMPISI